MKKFATILLVISLILPVLVRAEGIDFAEQLKKLATKNAQGYAGPLATAFGTSLNSGFYQTAKPHKFLGFDVSVKVAAVKVPDDGKVFDFYVGDVPVAFPGLGLPNDELVVDLELLYPERESPTLFGKDEMNNILPDPNGAAIALESALRTAGKTQAEIDLLKLSPTWTNAVSQIQGAAVPLTTPQGLNLSFMGFNAGFAMPQVSVGLPFKTEVMVRMIPEYEVDKVGKVSFFGFGVKHNLDQYIPIPLFPVDISAQFGMQQFKIGDIVESNHTAWNIQASKKLGIGLSITPYIGFGMESSSMDISYLVEGTGTILDGEKVDFALDGDNSFRTTVGVNLTLLLVTINADYSMGEYDAVTVGAGITFR